MTLNQKMISTYDKLLNAEVHDINERLKSDLEKHVGDMASRGMLHSGASAKEAIRIVSSTLQVKANVALLFAERCAMSAGVELDEPAALEFKDLVVSWLFDEKEISLDLLKASPAFSIATDSNTEVLLQPLETEYANTSRKIEARFEMKAMLTETMLSQSQQIPDHGRAPTIHINGTVGAVMTGDYITPSIIQNIDTDASQALTKAFDEILKTLLDDPSENPELTEVINDAKAELAKPKPNLLRIKGAVVAIKDAIFALPKMQASYQTLKWAATLLGVQLP